MASPETTGRYRKNIDSATGTTGGVAITEAINRMGQDDIDTHVADADAHHDQAHEGEHEVGGGDELVDGTTNPADIANAAADGTATKPPRQDHVHAHPSGLTADLHHTKYTDAEALTQAKALGDKHPITVEDPTASEDISIFFTPRALTIIQIMSVVRGTTPSVTWTIRHSTDRSAAGNEVVTSGTTTTSESTGDNVDSFNDATIPANSFVWLETTAKSGTVDELHLTLVYTID